jgi:alkanesulfonate monooxygenase SsuD/methylene tetrahydromethanopterin reductase-like flavin-dependent oxidoreductase (luciferase family)
VAIRDYRGNFKPSNYLERPQEIVTLGVVCADTETEAQRVFASTKLVVHRIRVQGKRLRVPTPEQAISELESLGPEADSVARGGGEWPRYIVGTPEQVREGIERVASDLRVAEIMILTVVHDHLARMRSYQLVAEAFSLPSRSANDQAYPVSRMPR